MADEGRRGQTSRQTRPGETGEARQALRTADRLARGPAKRRASGRPGARPGPLAPLPTPIRPHHHACKATAHVVGRRGEACVRRPRGAK